MRKKFPSMLVIAADDGLRSAWIDGFRQHGWQVYEAHDLRSAIDAAIQHQPAVVVATAQFPGATKFHYVRSIRVAVDHDVTIVGVRDDTTQEGAHTAGFDFLLSMPLDIAATHREVSATLAVKRYR